MKKRFILILSAVLTLSGTGTAWAAADPSSEAASVDELNKLRVRVAELEQKLADRLTNLEQKNEKLEQKNNKLEQKSDKVDIYSLGFIKYDYHNHGAAAPYFERGFKYVVGAKYKVDGNFVLTAENEYVRGFDLKPELFTNELKQINVQGNIGATNVVVGKYAHYDAIFDGEVMGAKVTAGDKLRTSVLYGRLAEGYGGNDEWNYDYDPLYGTGVTPQYFATEMSYALNKDTSVNASYTEVSDDAYPTAKYALVGLDTKLSRDVALKAFYGKSNYDTDNRTYMLGLQYKEAIPPIVGSNALWARYTNVDATSVIKSGYWGWNRSHGAKGVQIGYDFVPVKNTIFSLEIDRMKATNGDDWKDNFYRAQLGFFLF